MNRENTLFDFKIQKTTQLLILSVTLLVIFYHKYTCRSPADLQEISKIIFKSLSEKSEEMIVKKHLSQTFSKVHLNMFVDKIDQNMMWLLNWAKIFNSKKVN